MNLSSNSSQSSLTQSNSSTSGETGSTNKPSSLDCDGYDLSSPSLEEVIKPTQNTPITTQRKKQSVRPLKKYNTEIADFKKKNFEI